MSIYLNVLHAIFRCAIEKRGLILLICYYTEWTMIAVAKYARCIAPSVVWLFSAMENCIQKNPRFDDQQTMITSTNRISECNMHLHWLANTEFMMKVHGSTCLFFFTRRIKLPFGSRKNVVFVYFNFDICLSQFMNV